MKLTLPALLAGAMLLPFVSVTLDADADHCAALSASNAEQCLRLNHVQVLGTHNSYKRFPAPALVSLLNAYRDGWADDISYQHRPLPEQLEVLGIRQFELDVFADPDGGLFSQPAGGLLIDDPEISRISERMDAPGLKVLHSQDVDYRTTCSTLIVCLTQIRDWSTQNPTHLPIMIMLELKDGARQDWGPLVYTTPVAINTDNIFSVDEEIWRVFERSHVITPDDVRGDYPTLNAAVMEGGWPTLAESRGKVLFALDNTGRHLSDYLSRSPVLANRALFVSAEPGHPASGFLKMNNVIAEADTISAYAAQGYLIRTRSDVPSHEARTGDTTRRDLALASGAQYISTDYAEPSPLGSDYQVVLPDTDGVARCNPVSAPAACRSSWLDE
ncbi:phosphatidylinositol-specific phospholipase C1-like protein [Pseudohongiella sp.]|uniref:Phosphatidylinositol-specific phospholipase C X domain-containing protein n=1 Tax=marine sediment metagenome TaxID=412755 RepID=A0A0F9VZT2_9ZZZZ|nr:phosphatidylinositol-specific phospholipase C1-like protein [Pseudohongiella sp.]HDZ09773.1 hypothetical protein [Pseudohongiella sp.]HEA61613.1 hypothetical protein [Pseudohongiella sp.]